MESGITSRRLWAGVALELMPYAMFRSGLLFELAWRRSDAIYNIGVALFLISLISGLGWIAVGHPAGALAAFSWRALCITIFGAGMWMMGNCESGCDRGDPYWWTMQAGWFALTVVPAVSAFLLWRSARLLVDDDLGGAVISDHGGDAD